jgi:hypothetical protein
MSLVARVNSHPVDPSEIPPILSDLFFTQPVNHRTIVFSTLPDALMTRTKCTPDLSARFGTSMVEGPHPCMV